MSYQLICARVSLSLRDRLPAPLSCSEPNLSNSSPGCNDHQTSPSISRSRLASRLHLLDQQAINQRRRGDEVTREWQLIGGLAPLEQQWGTGEEVVRVARMILGGVGGGSEQSSPFCRGREGESAGEKMLRKVALLVVLVAMAHCQQDSETGGTQTQTNTNTATSTNTTGNYQFMLLSPSLSLIGI